MIVAMKIVVFLDVTPYTTESHLRVLKFELLQPLANSVQVFRHSSQ